MKTTKKFNVDDVYDELFTAKSVFDDIEDFVREEEEKCAFLKTEVNEERITKYITDRIDGLTEMCPILYSLSHDSAKENAETN